MSIQGHFERLRRSYSSETFSSYETRCRRLLSLQRLLVEREEDILQALTLDLGKSSFEGYLTEIALVKDEVEFALKSLRKWMKPKKVSGSLAFYWSKNYRLPEPLGLVLIISPWNYPFQLLMAPLVGAIAAGNAVVLKPSELAPATSELISKIVPQYFTNDEVVVVEGAVTETTELTNLAFDHIFFTGSTRVGKIIMQNASKNLVPVTLELGGKSPCLLFEASNFDLAVKRIIWGKFLNCGQTCVAPDYILLKKGMSGEFVNSAKKWLERFYGPQVVDSKDYGRIINSQQYARLKNLISPEKILYQADSDEKLNKLGPTILSAHPEDSVMKEEIFGPILPLIEVEDFQEALRFINARDKPLAAYLFTSDKNQKAIFERKISSGGMCINDVLIHLSNKNLPFGGVGPSGMGAYHGEASFMVFSHSKSVMRRSYWWENSLRYFPALNKLGLLKRILPWVS